MSVLSLLKSPDNILRKELDNPWRNIKFIGGKRIFLVKQHMKPGKNNQPTYLGFLLSNYKKTA